MLLWVIFVFLSVQGDSVLRPFSTEYHRLRHNGRNSFAFLQCAILSFVEENNPQVHNDLLNLRYIGVPVQNKNVSASSEICLLNIASHFDLAPETHLTKNKIISLIFKKYFPLSFYKIIRPHRIIRKAIKGQPYGKINLKKYFSNLSCLDYYVYQRVKVSINTTDSLPTDRIFDFPKNCQFNTTLAETLEEIEKKEEYSDYSTFSELNLGASIISFLFAPTKSKFDIVYRYPKTMLSRNIPMDLSDNALIKFILHNYYLDYRFPSTGNINHAFSYATKVPFEKHQMKQKSLLTDGLYGLYLTKLQHKYLVRKPQDGEGLVESSIAGFSAIMQFLSHAKFENWIYEFYFLKANIAGITGHFSFESQAPLYKFIFVPGQKTANFTTTDEEYFIIVQEIGINLDYSFANIRNVDPNHPIFSSFERYTELQRNMNSLYASIQFYLKRLMFFQDSFVDYRLNFKKVNNLSTQIYYTLLGNRSSFMYIYDLLLFSDCENLKRLIVYNSILSGFTAKWTELAEFMYRDGKKYRQRSWVKNSNKLLLRQIKDRSFTALYLALMRGMDLPTLKSDIKMMRMFKMLNYSTWIQLVIGLTVNKVKRVWWALKKFFLRFFNSNHTDSISPIDVSLG